MLTMAHRGSPLTLRGTGEIENLQRALIALSVATQRPAINTQVTGVVDDSTAMALSAALGLLTEELPTWLYLGLQAVMIAGGTTSSVKKYIGEYATQLAMAANTAAVKFKTSGVPAPVTPPVVFQPQPVGFFDQLFAPGWYKTPLGLVMIGVAAFLGYKYLLAPKKS